jgi:glycosyltransferase involved in cell wall biosynthesis
MTSIDLVLSPDASGHVVLDPADPLSDAMGGGSRAGFMGLAKAMARRGDYRVRAFSTFSTRKKVVDGLECLRLDERARSEHAQVTLAYYDTGPLLGCTSDLRIASHHTLIPYLAAINWIDVHTAPCQYAVEHLRRCFAPLDTWHVLPNAVEGLDGCVRAPVPGRVIYHTSPDRGLHRLLEAWPSVRDAVPAATLHIVGDIAGATSFQGTPERSVRGRRIAALKANLEAAQALPDGGGVKLLGRLRRADLLRELCEAACFAFPADVSAPCETWSASVHEAAWLGLPVVLAPVDALGMWEPYVRMCRTPQSHKDFAAYFASEVVRVLVDEDEAQWLSEAGQRVREHCSFDISAATLHDIVQGSLPKSSQ